MKLMVIFEQKRPVRSVQLGSGRGWRNHLGIAASSCATIFLFSLFAFGTAHGVDAICGDQSDGFEALPPSHPSDFSDLFGGRDVDA